MKSSRKWALGLAAATALLLKADIADYLRNLEASNSIQEVFFRLVPVGSVSVRMRRPPAETIPALTERIGRAPAEADLRAYRAWESERALRFDAAEADWKEYARLSPDKFAGYVALADYYHRRLQPDPELAALAVAANETNPIQERFTPPAGQRAWKLFERMAALRSSPELYRAWEKRYPSESTVTQRFFGYLLGNKQFAEAEQLLAAYPARFPDDQSFPVQAQANLAAARGSQDQALAVYHRAFRPLWPPPLIQSYFELLTTTHNLRRFLADARTAAAANPEDILPAARLFYYWQQQGNVDAARRALLEYTQRKTRWTAEELTVTARLFQGVNSHDDAAHAWYTLYTLPGAQADARRDALAELARLLLAAPDQPIRIGTGDLSLYRDIATADPHPGFLNGVLSLILNSTYPRSEFSTQEQAGIPYFHRAKAAELIGLLDRQFPTAPQRASLHADLIHAYSTYGVSTQVITRSKQYLTEFPKSPERTRVSLLMAEAYARLGQTDQELAVYSTVLQELGARADHMPLGEAVANAPRRQPGETPAETRTARSPEYARVLDLYLARLVALKRLPDALAVYRGELQRNPADPGLYERFAAFIEQNKLGAEVESVYQQAIGQFKERAWYERLARWYLRHKRTTDFSRLSDQVTRIFSGSDLEQYITGLVTPKLDAVLYRQVNLFANQRFPNNLTFVRNLLTAYDRPATRDALAAQRLLRTYWYHAPDLRDRYFESLSRSNQLAASVALVEKNPASLATRRWLGEAAAWQSHFEQAAPLLVEAAQADSGDTDVVTRAAAVERSLGHADSAVKLTETLVAVNPADTEALARIGDIWADTERFDLARPIWNRIPQLAPQNPGLYREAATVFWDYYLYDDALRLIAEGRANLKQPSLYTYEAGAIYENKRLPAQAIEEYVTGALATAGPTPERSRLATLATRPAWRDAIEARTARLNFDTEAALTLRTAILARQNRWKEMESLLASLAGRVTSLELLEHIGQEAEVNRFPAVREQVIARQAAVTQDPVERIRYQLSLARMLEDRQDLKGARRLIEQVYKANPAILGVVRTTVDFYTRTGDSARAVETLLHASSIAQDPYQVSFTLEASRKLTSDGDVKRARKLLDPLLAAKPFDTTYIAAMADTYAAAGDDAGLRDFYSAKLAAARASRLPVDTLRRGLIPALTRLAEFAPATDQYIELIKSYPDDDSLVNEAASYAAAHQTRDRILAYFAKAEQDSPRDSRWPIITARLATWFEDYPAAIAAWTRAAAIRPDRPDILTARAALEERLLRFDDAARTYAKLYDLNYHNPAWMAKLAEVHARQARYDQAEAELKKAYLDGRPDNPGNYLTVAGQLAEWNQLDRARPYLDKAVVNPQETNPVAGRLFARMRQYDLAVKHAGPEMGAVAAEYFTPEERAQLADRLLKMPADSPRREIAERAGLTTLQVQWMQEQALAQPAEEWLRRQLMDFQGKRLQFQELGQQLEAAWKAAPADQQKDGILDAAAEAYRSAGNRAEELRVLTFRMNHPPVSDSIADRYLSLLSANPKQLLATAAPGRTDNVRDRAVAAALAAGNLELALQAVQARGAGLPPVWTNAYTGLTALYFGAARANEAFPVILGPRTVGEQLGRKPDATREVMGANWFYYAGRYGDYLAVTRQPGSEDFLPAMVEDHPARAASYFDLAETYRERGDYPNAVAEYQRSIELDPGRGLSYDRIALTLAAQRRPDEATAAWRKSFESFTEALRRKAPAPDFWGNVRETMNHAGKHGAWDAIHGEVDALLRLYVRRNGSYMVGPLLQGLLESSADQAAAINWIADLSRYATDPGNFLENVLASAWLPESGQDVLYQRRIAAAETAAAKARGEERQYLQEAPRHAKSRYIEYLLDRKQAAQAAAVLATIEEKDRRSAGLETAELRLAALNGSIATVLDRYRRAPGKAPDAETLRHAAAAMRQDGHPLPAQQLLEFSYTNQLNERDFSASNFLGLAAIRLEQRRLPDALALLRRMTLIAGQPFENLLPASALLLHFGHTAEALPFLEQRVKAAPWDLAARRKLAETKRDTATLRAIAADPAAPYEERIAAARQAGPGAPLGSAELDAIAQPGPIAPASANQPYFYYARLEAAARAPDAKSKVPLLRAAVAERPDATAPRLPLFQAAIQSGNCAVAAAVTGRPDRELDNNDGAAPWAVRSLARGFFSDAGTDVDGRREAARDLAPCYEKLGNPDAAIGMLQVALRMDPPASEATALRARLTRLIAARQREQMNAQRRPRIAKTLDPDRIVRPRTSNGGAQ